MSNPVWKQDLEAVTKSSSTITGFIIPKADVNFLQQCDDFVSFLEQSQGFKNGHIKFIPLIETGQSVQDAKNLAKATNRNIAMNVGRYDLQSDLGCNSLGSEIIKLSLLHVAAAAKAEGLLALLSTNCELDNYNLFEKECMSAFDSGFSGRTCVTLAQVLFVRWIILISRFQE